MTPEVAELLQKAVRCYLAASLPDDACRCLEALGEHAAAARLHESRERWLPAAAGYERAGEWAAAARCHLRGGRPVNAADDLIRAGEMLEAAWVLADGARRFDRARFEVSRLPDDTDERRLGAELVLARCEAGTHADLPAARRIRAFTNRLAQLELPLAVRLLPWALAVTHALGRVDLTAELHAAAVAARLPGAEQQWERWALAELGDATGVPEPPSFAAPPETPAAANSPPT